MEKIANKITVIVINDVNKLGQSNRWFSIRAVIKVITRELTIPKHNIIKGVKVAKCVFNRNIKG